ncbi:MAG: hypothetical protein KF861_22790, partial [Planctomycetaceae bacterium]|nr:hypothetical protein [Planctomycetaceae bacterium]
MLTTVSWNVDADGFWDVGSNWSTGSPPQAGDDVVLDRPSGNFSVTYRAASGTTQITSITGAEKLTVTGGILDVANSIQLDNMIVLSGGTLRNASIVSAGDLTTVEVTSAGGTLDGVTLGVNTTLRDGAQVNVLNGLTLANNSTLRLERMAGSFNDGFDVGMHFAGMQTLGGTGSVELFGGTHSTAEGDLRLRPTGGGTLTIGPGVTVRNAAGSNLTTLGDAGGGGLVIQGTVSAQSTTGVLRVTGSSVTSTGVLQALNNATLDMDRSVAIDGSGLLAGSGAGVIEFAGNLTGNTTNADLYSPRGTVRFNGAGTAVAPQLLEAMSEDRGGDSTAFDQNFVYGTLALANNTYVRLTDSSDNSSGLPSEAVYTNFLIVPAGTTLDLNGLAVYARATLIAGSVVGGTVTQVADSGALAFGIPSAGAIAASNELDEWQFYGRKDRTVTIVLNPGGTNPPAPLAPRLNLAEVQIIDGMGNVVAAGSSSTGGAVVIVNSSGLPADGVYRVHIRGASAANVGNYVVTLWDSTVDEAALSLGQRSTGQIESPFSRDRWVFSATAGQQVKFDLMSSSLQNATFTLNAPSGAAVFSQLTNDSDLINLAET